MQDRIVMGKYYPVNSIIHSLNPLTKIIILFILFLIMIITNSFVIDLVIFLIINTGFLISKLPVNKLKKISINLLPIEVLIFLITLIDTKNILISLSSVINLLSFIIVLIIITMTTSLTEITYGLEMFLKPLKKYKVKTSEVSLKITNVIRFIPIFFDSKDKLVRKIKNHNIKPETNIIKGFIDLNIKAFKLAQTQLKQTSKMMDVRLYSIKEHRTNLRMNKFGVIDGIIIFIFVVILITSIVSVIF